MVMVTASTVISFLKHNHYNTNPPGPVEFFLKYNFPWLSAAVPQVLYKIKTFFTFKRTRKLPFELTYKYNLSPAQFDRMWDSTKGQWTQQIKIHGNLGLSYLGIFKLGARPDGFYNFKEFQLAKWGEDFHDTEIPIGTNLIELDKEMHDILFQIAENLRIPSELSQDFLLAWNKITAPIDNFEVIRTHNKLCKQKPTTSK